MSCKELIQYFYFPFCLSSLTPFSSWDICLSFPTHPATSWVSIQLPTSPPSSPPPQNGHNSSPSLSASNCVHTSLENCWCGMYLSLCAVNPSEHEYAINHISRLRSGCKYTIEACYGNKGVQEHWCFLETWQPDALSPCSVCCRSHPFKPI